MKTTAVMATVAPANSADIIATRFAGVAKLVDAPDSKSASDFTSQEKKGKFLEMPE